MALSLIAGPANAGKVELLLDRYLAALDREPVLIVPNRSDVDSVERELLAKRPALLAGTIGTFDDVFERIAKGAGDARSIVSDTQRTLLTRRAVHSAALNGLSASARFSGFAEELMRTVGELESSLLDPDDLEGDLRVLYTAYRDELDRLRLWDRDLLRRRAAERVRSDLSAWSGEPVFAYGFEDLTGAQWALLEALAGRADVTVSVPYEPGRPAFASLRRTAEDLQRVSSGHIEELPPQGEAHPALTHLERVLFSDAPTEPVAIDGAVRFFEGAGMRGVLELVGEELLALLRAGTPAERIGIVCPSVERVRAPLETAFATLGIPYSVDGEVRVAQTPFGQALTSLLRFAWLGGSRRELFTFLRSPFSGVERRAVDFVEGRLRGRAVQDTERVVEEGEKLHGRPFPGLAELRDADDPVDAARALIARMLRAAYGLDSPPVGEASRLDLRAYDRVSRVLTELERWRSLAGELSREDVIAVLERHTLRPYRGDEPGRVAVLDLGRARTRRFDVVFILGLEEGSLPRRGASSPFLDDDARRILDERGARLQRPDPVSRDRYLFYTACTRTLDRLYLVREAATDEGTPREPSPFWDEVQAAFDADDVRLWTRRRKLSALTWTLDDAPTERERLRALARLAAEDEPAAGALARANAWERRLERALGAFERPTRITHPLVLEQLGSRTTFNVTELERFADCSSAWFVDRFLSPRTIDAEVDAKLRGSVAHNALYKFFTRLPKELGVERLDERIVEDAVRLMRACLDEAVQGVRMDMTEMQARELDSTLWRDLEAVVRTECESELTLVPRRFEVLFGGERAAPELQRGLDLGDGLFLSGKIDRIDQDPFGARGIVQDYKSGKHAHSAREIESELRLQIPLYMLVLRDLVGLEPLGGLYRPLAGERKARGLLRASEGDTLMGFSRNDYLEEEAFWAAVDRARETASVLAGRIREGDVKHDPKGGDCPQWCDLWTICRIPRA
ncbi:MAG TPA: PD-(D/E)XK nuclease family protein [Gaiellaceae bacterium]|jgi:ATP-dependent helicase/DNAse subunit B